jgi:oligoribonuclease
VNQIPKFVVGDLETTGLNAKSDFILEAGFVLTDNELNIINQKSWLILNTGWESRLKLSGDSVREMHEKSGLIRDLREASESPMSASRHGITNVQSEIYTWLFNNGVTGNLPLTGSTISFDRRFLMEHMPLVDNCFSYRSIDISSIKELCRRWNPRVYAAYTRMVKDEVKAHRSLPDIHASIKELEFYMNEFLLVDFDIIASGQESLPL